jgi:hypothetical protein
MSIWTKLLSLIWTHREDIVELTEEMVVPPSTPLPMSDQLHIRQQIDQATSHKVAPKPAAAPAFSTPLPLPGPTGPISGSHKPN